VNDDTLLRLERLIAAPPERVFELWTEPEGLVLWWGPDGYDIPTHLLDVRPGGVWRTTMRSPQGELSTVSGVYRTIDAPRLLIFTWGWDDEHGVRGPETEVTVTFDPAPGGTRLILTQQPFANKQSRDNHATGWSSSLGCLNRLFQ
jgi:uncharacterized protein YndB with AHSA1/START domain